MLKPAYFYTNKDEIDRLIYDENCYEKLTLQYHDDFDQVEISSDKQIFENVKLNNGIGYVKDKNVITFSDYGTTAFYMKDENGWVLKFHEVDNGKIYYGINWLGGLIEEIKVGLDSLEVE